MYSSRITLFGICVFVIIAIQIPYICLSQAKDSVALLISEPQAVEMAQIPEYGKRTRKLISDIQLITSDYESLHEISRGITDVSKTLDDKLTFLEDTITILRLDRLDKEKRELSLLNDRLNQWKTTIQDFTNDGKAKDSTASRMVKVWQLTLNTISVDQKKVVGNSNVAESPDDLRTEIENFIIDIQTSHQHLKNYLDSLQNIQTEITIAENKFGTITDLIESNRTSLRQNIWIPEALPIWQVGKDTLQISNVNRIEDYVKSNFNIISAFLKNNPKLPYYLSIFIILIFGIILYIRSKAKDLYIDFPEEYQKANIVLNYPLLAALFISWFSLMFFPFFPKELNDLISFVMLVPLLIILRQLNSNLKWHTLLLFSISYLLFLFVRDINYSYLPQRIFLTFINVLIAILFFYYKKQKEQVKKLNVFWYGTLPFVINIFILLSIISLLGSIFGNLQLTQLLTYVSLGLIIAIHVLRTAVRLVQSFVFLILMGPMMKHSNILKEDGLLVLEKLDKLFRFVGFASLVYVMLDLLNIWNETIDAFVGFINYPLAVGELSISLGNILAFFITIQIAVWISSIIRYVLEKEVFPRTQLKHGIPNTILIMTKFTFVVLGVLFAFAAAGVQIDKLAIAMGALGVGIGFGLQNIISNFVSGIILALERPMTIGDLVEIPDVSGVVRDIGLRASTVRTWNGSDVIVPNATLISNKLTNWTFFDRLRRVKVDIRVPFDTNIEAVSKLLIETAIEIPEVMKKPKPYLNFKGIGTSAMEINLYCWINDSDKIFSYGTAIRKTVYKALLDAGYDTPVPMQDLKISSNPEDEKEKKL